MARGKGTMYRKSSSEPLHISTKEGKRSESDCESVSSNFGKRRKIHKGDPLCAKIQSMNDDRKLDIVDKWRDLYDKTLIPTVKNCVIPYTVGGKSLSYWVPKKGRNSMNTSKLGVSSNRQGSRSTSRSRRSSRSTSSHDTRVCHDPSTTVLQPELSWERQMHLKISNIMEGFEGMPWATYSAALPLLKEEQMLCFFPAMTEMNRLKWLLGVTPSDAKEDMMKWMRNKGVVIENST